MKIINQDDPDFLDGIPTILYKYRNWDINFHRDLVLNGQIYFSSLDQLNDPFEGSIPFRYKTEDLTIENLYVKYKKFRTDTNPSVKANEIETGWQEQLKLKWWNNEAHKKSTRKSLKKD